MQEGPTENRLGKLGSLYKYYYIIIIIIIIKMHTRIQNKKDIHCKTLNSNNIIKDY